MERKIGVAVLLVLSMVWQAHAAVNCIAAGRFADPDDSTCKNYTLCVYSSNSGSYLTYNYVCPSTSVFNPSTGQCTDSSNYECPVKKTSVCTESGYFPDINSTNCTSYIECINIDGTFIESLYYCPYGTYYEPNTTWCVTDYICPFTCIAPGRFADTSDPTCHAYFFCVLDASNKYIQLNYTCPTTSVFNPNSRVCTTDYTCTN